MKISQRVIAGCQRGRPGFRRIVALAAMLVAGTVLPASAATLDRIKETGHIRLGYLVDAKPLTYLGGSGKVEGYSAVLCEKIADSVKEQLGLPALAIDWVPLALDNRVEKIQQGEVDLLCTPMTETMMRRQDMAFSIPVFPAGVRAVLRKDAAKALREALSGAPVERPLWRGSPAAKLLEKKSFAVVKGTTTEQWLSDNLASLQIDARIILVDDYRTGLKDLLDRKVDVFFGDRAVVLGALEDSERAELEIFSRMLTHEALALGMARGDEDFRLMVDGVLSQGYISGQFGDLYGKWFGEFNSQVREFFLWSAVKPQ